MSRAAGRFIADLHQPPTAPRPGPPPPPHLAGLGVPGDGPRDFGLALRQLASAAADGIDHRHPLHLAHIPSGGLFLSALGEWLARGLNRYTGLNEAPGLVALERDLLGWMCSLFRLPADTAGGITTTGASLAALTALVAAREDRLGENIGRGILYVSPHTHFSIAKAARIAGMPTTNIRTVPVTRHLTMDPHQLDRQIRADRAAGYMPCLIAATAGTTDTGAIDPLGGIAAIAAHHRVWLHIDAAHGGFYILTHRGRNALAGIHHADSIAVDAHKGLSMGFGSGHLLVRDVALLQRAFRATGPYLDERDGDPYRADFASLGPELTREYRALRVWLPLVVHGVGAFTQMLDERLDLAREAYAALAVDPLLELPWAPVLSTVVFRPRHGRTLDLLQRIHTGSSVRLSATAIAGQDWLRICLQSHRVSRDNMLAAVAVIRHATRRHTHALPSHPIPSG